MFSMKNLEPASKRQRPEVLAPVGNLEMFKAAIHHGADAVYVGMPGYNARARTEDMSFEQLGEMIQEAHLYGVKVLVAFNILIFQEELGVLLPDLQALIATQPDAIIVQDMGLVRLIRALSPHQVIHGSTQMTVTHHRAIHLLEDLDIKRFVLGREVSMTEMKDIRDSTERELEVFVHGALCVAYSGQCLTSESFGGRSANRGQCAQSCRLPYDLIVDGEKKDMGARQHLVSPKDLCGLEDVPALVDLGIDSFKIEGRYKSPEYVATTSSSYKKAIARTTLDPEDLFDMEVSFSRGTFTGWLKGADHNQLVDGISHAHRGSHMGSFVKWRLESGNPTLVVDLDHVPEKGDSLLFTDARGANLVGGKVYEVTNLKDQRWELSMAQDFDAQQLKGKGIQVFCQRSPARDKKWQRQWKDKALGKKIPLTLWVRGSRGETLCVEAEDDLGHKVKVYSEQTLEPASKRALDEDSLQKGLGGWGGSCFQVQQWNFHVDGDLFLPMGQVKLCRQMAQESLERLRSQHQPPELKPLDQVQEWMDAQAFAPQESMAPSVSTPSLRVLIREPAQLEAIQGTEVSEVILDYRHGVAYGPSIQKVREMGYRVSVATTRIVKPGEERRLNDLLRLRPDGVLVRNLSALHFFNEHREEWSVPLSGDFSLNVCNHLSASYLLGKGLEIWCPSYDLNLSQLKALLGKVNPEQVELTLHQYMPSFHMEHCVFATFLSNGHDITDCGMVCRQHKVELRDSKGVRHPLLADQECRNTMFNGVPQSVASVIPEFLTQGVKRFRLEALTESPEELRQKITGYLDVLHGHMKGRVLKERLGLSEKFGVTEGQVLSDRTYVSLKK